MRKGYTLVELSITLVMIGFITFMIFRGHALYEGAKTRAAIKTLEKIKSSLVTLANNYGENMDYFRLDRTDGTYDAKLLLVDAGLLTEDDLNVYQQPAVWDFRNCALGLRGAATHEYTDSNMYIYPNICISGAVSEQFSCYTDKILDDDNRMSGNARNHAQSSADGNFAQCITASLATITALDFIVY
jgi:hypothetical protein